ncbi:ribosomal protein L21 [Burkholderia pseudomallei MSHR4372]|nr:ribosomal protein L21 [Burkholderia pseudomallei MSHR4372]
MYAVIKTGGKQYKVAVGEKLKVEQIPADIDAEITLDQVLAVGEGESIQFGTPLVSGASVKATVVSHGRHAKVTIFKMRRRKHFFNDTATTARTTPSCASTQSTRKRLPR